MNARVYRRCLVTVSCLVFVLTAGARQVGTQGNNKSIFVSVLDAEGKPVTGMTAGDFAIREDNADRKIVEVKPATQPIYIAMLVDTSTAATGFVQDIREGFSGFARQVLGKSPESQLSLWEFGQAAVRVENFTTDVTKLTDKVNRLFPRLNASSVLSEAIKDASDDLARKPSPRRAIVVLNIEPSSEQSQEQPQQINDSLLRSHAQLWVVSLQKGTLKNAKRDLVLNTLVRNAGGTREYIVAESAAPMQLAKIADALTSQYEIVYERPGDNAKIVQVGQRTGKDLKIVTGIFAPK
jgi:VWFA-related protein